VRKVLLISNRVMHYRVSVYNYFYNRFKEFNWEFIVRGNQLQKQNPYSIEFDFQEIEFNFRKYKDEIRKIKPDVVIIFLHLKDIVIWPLLLWLKTQNIPIVFWTKGANLDEPDSKFRYHLFNFVHGICDRLILYSQNEIKCIKEKNRHKVFVANNTVNFKAFPEIRETKDEIKNEFGISFDKVVLSVGRMGEGGGRKKIHHLIEIFNDINTPGVGLVIVGSGVNNGLLNKTIRSNTVYLGEIHDPQNIQISKIFKMADVFSIPGHIGLGVNQAFYWGLPVVTGDYLQPPEIQYIINGRNGFIIPSDDINELKNKILYLLENDSVREEFSKNAREDILKNASIENMFMGFKKCLDSLVTI
jgi:glycosyltransferase involved in cell wall biosynthesis